MAPLAETNRLKATLIGLGKAIYAPLAFLFPLDLIVLVLFPGVLREGWAAIKRAVSPRTFRGASRIGGCFSCTSPSVALSC
jgi:hypothetical protein